MCTMSRREPFGSLFVKGPRREDEEGDEGDRKEDDEGEDTDDGYRGAFAIFGV